MTSTPAFTLVPRDAGALYGEIIPGGTACPMDDMAAVNDDVIVLRRADFAAYRSGAARPVSLGKGCTVIPFRPRDLPDMTNVIAANFGRPAAPAAAMPRAA